MNKTCWMALGAACGLLLAAIDANAQSTKPVSKALDQVSADAGGGTEEPSVAELEEKLRADLETWQRKKAEFEQLRDTVPQRLREVGDALENARNIAPRTVSPGQDAEQLEYQLTVAEEELSDLRDQVVELDAEPSRRAQRRKDLPAAIATARDRLRALEMGTQGRSSNAREAEQARELRLRELQEAVLEAEIAAHEAELSSYEARVTLLTRRRDLAELQAEAQAEYVTQLRDAVAEAQRENVQADARRARRMLDDLEGLPPKVQQAVRELAERNLAFSELWTGDGGLIERIATVSERLARARQQVTTVRADLARLTAKVEAAGLADSVGAMLRRERADAPDVGMYRRFVRMRSEQITEAQLQQLRLAEQREAVADVESRVRETLLTMGDELSDEQRARVERLLRELFDNQRNYMDALVADHDEYFRKLVAFDEEQRALISESERLIDFINERVLWVRSGSPMGPELPGDLLDSLAWLGGSRYLGQLQRAMRASLRERPLTYLALLLALLASLLGRKRLNAQVRALSADAQNPQCGHFAATGRALGLSLVVSASPPLLIFALGQLLESAPAATQYTRAVAHGTWATALLWGSLAIPRHLLREDGVVQAHCQWPRVPCLRLRRHLLWLGPIAAVATFVMFTAESRADDAMRESLARVVFLLLMMATSVFSHLVLREHGAMSEILRMRQSRRIPLPTRRALHAVLTLAPLALAILAAFGFYWTGLQLSVRLHLTLCLLLGVVITSDLLHRWAAIAQRNVAAAREQEAREIEERESHVPGASSTPGSEAGRPSMLAADVLDLSAVSEQTRRLTASLLAVGSVVGLAAVWADLLPAAGILRKVELWRVQKALEPGATDAATEAAAEVAQWVPVTLADLGLALLIGALCVVLLRNLPGLLEVTLFRRLQTGERYAFATILKYIIGVAGLTLALESLGISWSSLQWLVAAVGLGLGFGLQEIFANFVSGILILLERPIRVGDLVTVGGISGKVTRIHIRATWITTFERKELIVPNKEFVTSQLVNWSLSDPILRVTVPVGIAYGSDVQLALRELQRVAEDNPRVVDDPATQVLFLGFGDSSLDLELRAFVGDSGDAVSVKHELHVAVDEAFRAAGIQIPFPQRDVHLLQAPAETPSEPKGRPDPEPEPA